MKSSRAAVGSFADRLPSLRETVRKVAAELTVALGGVMPATKSA